jgi:hypothetical protein
MSSHGITLHGEVIFRAGLLAGKVGRVISIKGDMITVEVSGTRMRVGRSEVQAREAQRAARAAEERPILSALQAFEQFRAWLDSSPFAALAPCIDADDHDPGLSEELAQQSGFPLPQSVKKFLRAAGRLRVAPVPHPAFHLAPKHAGLAMLSPARWLAHHEHYLEQSQQGQPDNRFLFAAPGTDGAGYFLEDNGDKKAEYAIAWHDPQHEPDLDDERFYPSFDAWVTWTLDDLRQGLSRADPAEVLRAAAPFLSPDQPSETEASDEAAHWAALVHQGGASYEDPAPRGGLLVWQVIARYHADANEARRALPNGKPAPVVDLLYRLPEEGRRGRLAFLIEVLQQAGRLPSQPELALALAALERQVIDPDSLTPSNRRHHLEKASSFGWKRRGYLSGSASVEALWGRCLAWLLGRPLPEHLHAALSLGYRISKAVGGKLSPELVQREILSFVPGMRG